MAKALVLLKSYDPVHSHVYLTVELPLSPPSKASSNTFSNPTSFKSVVSSVLFSRSFLFPPYSWTVTFNVTWGLILCSAWSFRPSPLCAVYGCMSSVQFTSPSSLHAELQRSSFFERSLIRNLLVFVPVAFSQYVHSWPLSQIFI